MSILIKDMKMPKTCGECNYCHYLSGYYSGYYCRATNQSFRISADVEIEKPHGCPLVEIPSDIDLIDKNKLYEKVAELEAQALEQASKLAQTDNIEEWRRWSTILNERTAFKFDVADAPVIIPAE